MNTIKRESRRIEGRVSIVVRDARGTAICERRASNVVLRSGAELVAALLSGKASTPINGVVVGVNSEPPSPPYEGGSVTTTAPDGTPVIELAAAPIDPAIIAAEVLADQLKVRISLRSVIGPNRAVSPDENVKTVQIGEAALGVLAADGNSLATTYNRVVFEPVPKGRDQEMALYWEIDFPYGI